MFNVDIFKSQGPKRPTSHRSNSLPDLPSAGPEHDRFVDWAMAQGIEINDIAPVRFRGKGIGIAAHRKIAAGEILVSVPIPALFTVDKIPASFKARFQHEEMSVQGLFAAYFAWDRNEEDKNEDGDGEGGDNDDDDDLQKYAPWQAVWPTMQDFKDSMPLLWPSYLSGQQDLLPPSQPSAQDSPPSTSSARSFLPPSISGSFRSLPTSSSHDRESHGYPPRHQNQLAEQTERLEKAYGIAKRVLPSLDREKYIYHWLLVNTRSFYYVPKGSGRPDDGNDAMAMCPFADYFNHSDDDSACEAVFDHRRYVFKTRRDYEAGEEIFVPYGNHSNDVLLTEYGFLLQRNQSDCIYLDDIILKDLTEEQKEDLRIENYLGNYELSNMGPCYRTYVAAARTYLSYLDWNRYILGHEPRSFDESKTNQVLAQWISEYIKDANLALSEVKHVKATGKDKRHVVAVVSRWKQIIELCHNAMDEIL